ARRAEGHQAQGSEGLDDHRQAPQAARHGRQDQWQDDLRHRRQATRPAQRRGARVPRVRRQGEELRRLQGRDHAGHQKSRSGRRQRGGGGGGYVVHAKSALDAAPIEWDNGPNAKVSSASIAELLKDGLDAEQAFVGNEHGDIKAAIARAAKKVEAVYAYPYQNHATMEPMNATPLYTSDKCEVWCGAQTAEPAIPCAAQRGEPARAK